MKKSSQKALEAYKKYYIDREYEQVDLFHLLKERFGISNAIYPGSYVQISPSFVFPHVVYIDSDKNAVRLFADESFKKIVIEHKTYPEDPQIIFHGADYQKLIDAYRSKFDLLISQYAGFISGVCKPYLKPEGYLLVNNSHGDAGMASLDEDYKLIAAVHRSKGKHRLSTASLESYFIPKKDVQVTRKMLLERKRGLGTPKPQPFIFSRR
jgi:hypothetical protein